MAEGPHSATRQLSALALQKRKCIAAEHTAQNVRKERKALSIKSKRMNILHSLFTGSAMNINVGYNLQLRKVYALIPYIYI
jgi:hypothetical protein